MRPALMFALLAVGLTWLSASPASAKKKKHSSSAAAAAPASDSTDTPQATDSGDGSAAPAADEKPAVQASDTEKPKAILDTNQEAPKTDSLGHVHFSSPNGEGLGRVVVKAPATDKVKVFLEGRLFGTAPVTIYSVPKGDYIVEMAYPDGKEVSKPVTVAENEETAVDLTAPAAKTADNGGSFGGGEMTPFRKNLMYGFAAGAAVGLVVGVTFGILDLKAESDYNSATTQANRDSIQNTGTRDAAIADAGFVLLGVGAVGAIICAWPMIFGGGEKAPAGGGDNPGASSTAFLFAPMAGHGVTGGSMMLRF